jgi:hypothetical protein
MNDGIGMQVVQSAANLGAVNLQSVVIKDNDLHIVFQIASCGEIEDEKQVVIVLESISHIQNESMMYLLKNYSLSEYVSR